MNEPKTSYPKEKIKILLLENISDKAVNILHDHGYTNIKRVTGAMGEDELVKAIKDVHLLGIRSKTQVTKRVLAAAKKLQAVGCYCIGVNQVDLHAATKNGVAVFNAPYSNTRSVAELVIGAAIMLIRKIPGKNKAAHEGYWMKDAKGSYELRGKTLGIIGYGNIGSQVSILAEALGMKVLFYDVETKMPLGNALDRKNLKDLVAQSDIISLHVPETPATYHIINRNLLKKCKQGAIIINFARGGVVDLAALQKSIEEGHISGAAIDVFPSEPEKNGDLFTCELQGLSNVLLTPHIGGSTEEAQQNIGEDVTAKLLQFLERGISTGSHTIPALSLPPQEGAHRILHIHNNVPGVLGDMNTRLSESNINIVGQYLKTNENVGYVVLDVDKRVSAHAAHVLTEVKETIKVRVLY